MEQINKATGLISETEKETALYCIEYALQSGASQMRVSLNKSVMDSFSILNGELDKITHSADSSLFMYIFADGRYGTFSTNNFEKRQLKGFIDKAINTVRMLASDMCRQLPDPDRVAKNALTGNELGLYDTEYHNITPEQRLNTALASSIFKRTESDRNYSIVSEECEYSDSIDDNFTADSSGFRGRHIETSFAICSEVTVCDAEGNRLSGYWWESSPFRSGLLTEECSHNALKRATDKIGPQNQRGGKYKAVIDRSVSSRLFSPIISALNGTAIQQKNSFLEGKAGEQVFPEYLTVSDMAHSSGKPGSRLYDTEGVATSEFQIIDRGVITGYFVNTYIAKKTGMHATIEGASRPVLRPFITDSNGICISDKKEIHLTDILNSCGSGIYITGFNGGNCNQTTGDFSYGVEGFAFKNGKITHPVREMVITGNIVSLWKNIIAAGTDARMCTRWQIPTLAFKEADFSA